MNQQESLRSFPPKGYEYNQLRSSGAKIESRSRHTTTITGSHVKELVGKLSVADETQTTKKHIFRYWMKEALLELAKNPDQQLPVLADLLSANGNHFIVRRDLLCDDKGIQRVVRYAYKKSGEDKVFLHKLVKFGLYSALGLSSKEVERRLGS